MEFWYIYNFTIDVWNVGLKFTFKRLNGVRAQGYRICRPFGLVITLFVISESYERKINPNIASNAYFNDN